MTYLLCLLIPLLIAYKDKKNDKFGFTRSGTVMAVINIGYYIVVFSAFGISQNVVSLIDWNGKNEEVIDRAVIVGLMFISLLPTFNTVKKEYRDFDWRTQTCTCCRRKKQTAKELIEE
jgi:hypothetical protein